MQGVSAKTYEAKMFPNNTIPKYAIKGIRSNLGLFWTKLTDSLPDIFKNENDLKKTKMI